MAFKLKNKKLLKIVKELKKASKMHAAQADKVEEFAKGPCGKPTEQCECKSKTLPGISPLSKKDPGVDGKPCWPGFDIPKDGPKTKKKGGKTVDNCVKQ
tara:strand:- start:224 stop:520 length:297 start_codon:yes stop_codon:yes gene_type:complete